MLIEWLVDRFMRIRRSSTNYPLTLPSSDSDSETETETETDIDDSLSREELLRFPKTYFGVGAKILC